MTEDKRPRLWVIDSAGGECRLDVERAIQTADRLGVSVDRIMLWGKRTPLDPWSMSASEICTVLEAAVVTAEHAAGEVDRS